MTQATKERHDPDPCTEVTYEGPNPTPFNGELTAELGNPFREIDTTLRDEDGSPMSLNVDDIVADVEAKLAQERADHPDHPVWSFDAANGEKIVVVFDPALLRYRVVSGVGQELSEEEIRAQVQKLMDQQRPADLGQALADMVKPAESAESPAEPPQGLSTAEQSSPPGPGAAGPPQQAVPLPPTPAQWATMVSGDGATRLPSSDTVPVTVVPAGQTPPKKTPAHRRRPRPHP
jgi:hypothetical protein